MSGIEIIDHDGRIYIIEGLKDKSITKIYNSLPKDKYCTVKQKILKNTKIKFTSRIYSEFNIELKRVNILVIFR